MYRIHTRSIWPSMLMRLYRLCKIVSGTMESLFCFYYMERIPTLAISQSLLVLRCMICDYLPCQFPREHKLYLFSCITCIFSVLSKLYLKMRFVLCYLMSLIIKIIHLSYTLSYDFVHLIQNVFYFVLGDGEV